MEESRNNLTRKQKLALTGLTIFGIFIVGLWMFNLKQQINGPMAYKSSGSANQSAATVSEEEKQKTQDTDGDGISDWDELNIYNTSPYLADSDSDGLTDGVEVKNGTDPNCPQGKDCKAPVLKTSDTTVDDLTKVLSSSPINSSDILTNQFDMASLRNQFLEAGVDQKILDQVSDEVLLQAYADVIASSTKK